VTLYHFTGLDHAQAIKREGITKGAIYIPGHILRGYIWLTDDPRFEAQNWATNHSGQCGDRTEARFTLELDDAIPWAAFARGALNMSRTGLLEFNLAGGSDGSHWFIAKAPLGRDKIKELICNPRKNPAYSPR
jgi:hypothetical protein